MADREILTLKRKTTNPVITTVAEKPKPLATVELPAPKKPKKIKPNWEIICQLIKTYPQTFFFKDRKPLAVGIFNKIVEEMPQLCQVRLRFALWKYCSNKKYLRSIITETYRVDLTGQPVGTVTEKEKHHAEQKLVYLRTMQKKARQAKRDQRLVMLDTAIADVESGQTQTIETTQ